MDVIKNYVLSLIAGALIIGFAYTKWELYSVTKEYHEYRANIEEQVRIAKEKAAKIKLEQDAKYEQAQKDYAASARDLDAALARLRDIKAMSGNSGLRMAGRSTSGMSAETADSRRIAPAITIEAGVRQTAFYAEAMKDTLQCQRLIEFVKD